jgi:uncharacterized protein with beta-barrel porin domain
VRGLLLSGAALAVTPTPSLAQNLITNPGFESGTTGWTFTTTGGNTGVAPPTFTLGAPHTGTNFAEFGDPGNPGGTATQTVSLTAAGRYQFSYWLANTGGAPNFFTTTVGGNQLSHLSNQTAFAYTQFTFNVTALAGPLTIQFTGLHGPADYNLDDVSLMFLSFLTLSQNLAPNAPTNQKNVATAIDTVINAGGTLPSGFAALTGLTPAQLTPALTQLSGEAATGAQQAAFQMGGQFLTLMLDPFANGRSGPATSSGHMGFAPDRPEMTSGTASAYAAITKAAPYSPPADPRWNIWGTAFGGSNKASGDAAVVGSHDRTANVYGFASGFDYRVAPDTVVGFALAGGGTNWGLSEALGGGRSDAFQAGVYGTKTWGSFYAAGSLAFTDHWITTDRIAMGGHLTAGFDAQNWGGRLEGGNRYATTWGTVTPYAAVQAQSFKMPGYSETDPTGGGFGLTYNSKTATDIRSELGTRYDQTLTMLPLPLTFHGRVAWAHDWVSDPILAATFQALPGTSFIVNGATPARDSALVSAGGELRVNKNISLIGKFDGEFASRSTTYAGTGTFRYSW